MMRYFSIQERNPGHWDIGNHTGRQWRIRGEPWNVIVHDERDDLSRPFPRDPITFKTVSTAFAWIADHYMAEGQPS